MYQFYVSTDGHSFTILHTMPQKMILSLHHAVFMKVQEGHAYNLDCPELIKLNADTVLADATNEPAYFLQASPTQCCQTFGLWSPGKEWFHSSVWICISLSTSEACYPSTHALCQSGGKNFGDLLCQSTSINQGDETFVCKKNYKRFYLDCISQDSLQCFVFAMEKRFRSLN